ARAGSATATARTGELDVLAARAGAADPARALARGWSITRTGNGSLVRSTADVVPGTTLRTTLGDGTLTSTVDAAAPHVPHRTEEEP
ncbi:MAG: hypothetical protein M3503_03690, partial [Actinomycetota bacterium]|nr:hypothetical protein [Actinomycetota bacterium]